MIFFSWDEPYPTAAIVISFCVWLLVWWLLFLGEWVNEMSVSSVRLLEKSEEVSVRRRMSSNSPKMKKWWISFRLILNWKIWIIYWIVIFIKMNPYFHIFIFCVRFLWNKIWKNPKPRRTMKKSNYAYKYRIGYKALIAGSTCRCSKVQIPIFFLIWLYICAFMFGWWTVWDYLYLFWPKVLFWD